MSVYEAGKPSVNEGHLTQSELHLYGSSRIGLLRRSFDVAEEYNPADTTMPLLGIGLSNNFGRGNKLFELSNHLGNVLVTVNDKKLGVSSNNNTVDYFNPQVVSAQDYYPFGMLQVGRVFNTSGYRFGFNGKENDNEVKGEGGQQDYGMRIYDVRIARFLSEDPITKQYPELTPYQFASNSPIQNIDLDGMEGVKNIDNTEKVVVVRVDIDYVPRRKDMSKDEKKISFSQKEINNLRSGLLKELSKKDVPNTIRFINKGRINPATGKMEDVGETEDYTIRWEINFIAHENYNVANAAIRDAANDIKNPKTLLQKAVPKEQIIPNPSYDPSDPESPESFKRITMGSSNWRTTKLRKVDGHTITHELFHNMIHLHLAGNIRIANTDAGHASAGGIFVYENAQLGTTIKNVNAKNIYEMYLTLPLTSGSEPGPVFTPVRK